MKDSKAKQSPSTIGDSAYITKWTILIVAGCLLEFCGRFIGYDKNPLGLYFPIIAAATVIVAAVIGLYGFLKIWRDFDKKDPMKARTGYMLIVMSLIMIVSFMLFRTIMPLIFGYSTDPAPVDFLGFTTPGM